MKIRTENRIQRIEDVLKKKQKDLTIVCENIHDPHNVSAILRTCDAVGIFEMHLLYYKTEFPDIGKRSSAGVRKWIKRKSHSNPKECMEYLKNEGYKTVGTRLNKNAVSIYDYDFTQKTAIILGNEHSGISEELIKYCDNQIYIPMNGMVESLNVSVACAVTLYEAYRQRKQSGLYENQSLSNDVFNQTKEEWLLK